MHEVRNNRALLIRVAVAAVVAGGALWHSMPAMGQKLIPRGPTEPDPRGHLGSPQFEHYKVVRATITSHEQLDSLMSMGAVAMNCVPGVGEMDLAVSPHVLQHMREANIPLVVLIENLQERIDSSVARMRAQAAAAGAGEAGQLAGPPPNWFDDYKTYPQVNDYLASLAALRPDLATPITIGTSIEGRAINGLRITSSRGPAAKPAILINGCQHAREWVVVMVPTYIADSLVRNYDSNAQVQAVLDNLEVFIVPIVNPDGYEFSYAVNGNRMWRKNRRDNGDGTIGVDLNRNWGVNWAGPYSCTSDPAHDLYYGTAAFSEPETQALRDLMLANPQIRGHIDFHNYGQLVLQPWSGHYSPPPQGYDLLDSLGSKMNAAIFGAHATQHSNGWGGHLLYLASGVIPDWCYGERGILSYTVEVRDKGIEGFFLSPEHILPTCREQFAGVLAMAQRLMEGAQFFFPVGAPSTMPADGVSLITFVVRPITTGPINLAGVNLFWRDSASESFTTVNAQSVGMNRFEAELPALPCGEIIEYYLEAQSQSGPTYRWPAAAPLQVHQARSVQTLVNFDFQSEAGWSTSSDGAFHGLWTRGIPVISFDWPYDPPVDADGSGHCYVTGNIISAFGNADVDGGSVTLTSPTLDLSNVPGHEDADLGGGAVVAYSYFLHIVSVGDDAMVVEMNNADGVGPWIEVARHTENTGQYWRQHMLTQAQLEGLGLPMTSTMRIRFTVNDGAPDTIVEGGVDAVKLMTACAGPPRRPLPCPADIAPPGNLNGAVDIDDLVLVITSWGQLGLPGTIAADVNDDGLVNIDDLVGVITAWGACP